MVAHLQFHTSQRTSQNCKRATKPTHQDRHEMITNKHDRKEGRSANSTYQKAGLRALQTHLCKPKVRYSE